MTPEERFHEEEYYAAKNRYSSAAYSESAAEARISELRSRRSHLLNKISQMKAERKSYSSSLEEIGKGLSKNSDFESAMRDTQSKLDTASSAFLAIGQSSVGTLKNLNDVFGDTDKKTYSSVSGVFGNLKQNKAKIQGIIDSISGNISQFENELSEGKNEERRLQEVVREEKRKKNRALEDMAYHKRYMSR